MTYIESRESRCLCIFPPSPYTRDLTAPNITFQISGDRSLAKSRRLLNSDLTCPICLGILNKTKIVMEVFISYSSSTLSINSLTRFFLQCLHRFCADCIQKCLRVGKKECPSCRIHVPSRRSLRSTPSTSTEHSTVSNTQSATAPHSIVIGGGARPPMLTQMPFSPLFLQAR